MARKYPEAFPAWFLKKKSGSRGVSIRISFLRRPSGIIKSPSTVSSYTPLLAPVRHFEAASWGYNTLRHKFVWHTSPNFLHFDSSEASSFTNNQDDPKVCCANDQGSERIDPSQALLFKRELLNCGVCAKSLSDLGIKKVRSITSNPDNDATFETYGIELTERVSI